MMKRCVIALACIIALLLLAWLIYARFFDILKPTYYLNFQINVDDISRINVGYNTTEMYGYDERGVYKNKDKIQIILNYLNDIPLVEVDKSEVPNISVDCSFTFVNQKLETVASVGIYSGLFIKNNMTGQYFRSKNERNSIRDELQELTMKF